VAADPIGKNRKEPASLQALECVDIAFAATSTGEVVFGIMSPGERADATLHGEPEVKPNALASFARLL
jgi:hypothetical protein